MPETPAHELPANAFAKVPLASKINRAETSIDALSLIKPQGPALMGVSLYDLMRMDTGAIVKVLPRITSPTITEAEAMMLEGHDLFRIGQEISAFLLLSGPE